MLYFFISVGIVWAVSRHNEKYPIDEELIKEGQVKWVNELIENL